MDDIVSTEGVMGGEPRLEGHRISVRQIAEMVIEGGDAPAYVADQLGVSLADVHLALAYHYRHPEEMKEIRERRRERIRKSREEAIQPPDDLTR
jgi:uncharacterized protein (DUF433 family)